MKILISPLDWGLGHATRLIPIVDFFIKRGDSVIIGGTGSSIEKLKRTFPSLPYRTIPSFSPWFSKYFPQWLAISLQVPRFLFYILREHSLTQKIVKQDNIDIIVSDNRYGLHCRNCHSYIITHQTMPRAATWSPNWFNKLLSKIICRFINKFNACLIPDLEPSPYGISGQLSDTRYIKTKIKHIGILSQLSIHQSIAKEYIYNPNFLAIISGPEPQRTIFQVAIQKYFAQQAGQNIIVTGLTCSPTETQQIGNITIISGIDVPSLKSLIINTQKIICRSGYSTIMDLYSCNKVATLIPTPGQAEQEYLAKHLSTKGFSTISQKKLFSLIDKKKL